MHPESKPAMYSIFEKNQRLWSFSTVCSICVELLHLLLRQEVWSITQLQDWPEHICSLRLLFFTLKLRYWLSWFQGIDNGLASQVCCEVSHWPFTVRLRFPESLCTSSAPQPELLPTLSPPPAASKICPAAFWHQMSTSFLCTTYPLVLGTHTAPCVLSQEPRVGDHSSYMES